MNCEINLTRIYTISEVCMCAIPTEAHISFQQPHIIFENDNETKKRFRIAFAFFGAFALFTSFVLFYMSKKYLNLSRGIYLILNTEITCVLFGILNLVFFTSQNLPQVWLGGQIGCDAYSILCLTICHQLYFGLAFIAKSLPKKQMQVQKNQNGLIQNLDDDEKPSIQAFLFYTTLPTIIITMIYAGNTSVHSSISCSGVFCVATRIIFLPWMLGLCFSSFLIPILYTFYFVLFNMKRDKITLIYSTYLFITFLPAAIFIMKSLLSSNSRSDLYNVELFFMFGFSICFAFLPIVTLYCLHKEHTIVPLNSTTTSTINRINDNKIEII